MPLNIPGQSELPLPQKAPVVRERKTIQDVLLAEGLLALKLAHELKTPEELQDILVKRLGQNSRETRRRYAQSIVRWFFPDGLNGLLPRVWLVYQDEDCPNQERAGFYRRALINQAVAKLVCDLNLQQPEKPYVTTARDLLWQTTDGILDYVGRERQTNMVRIVRQNVFNRIADFWRGKQFSPVKFEADRLEITFRDKGIKADFMDWLEDAKKTTFSDQMPPQEPPFLPGMEPGTTPAP